MHPPIGLSSLIATPVLTAVDPRKMPIMIRITQWLVDKTSTSVDSRYRHRMFKENPIHRMDALVELEEYVQKAHEDACRHYSQMTQESLDPLESEALPDFLGQYPSCLDLITLQGWFGEVFAGLIAEYFNPFDEPGWKVPVFLFRFHQTVFDQLERIRQTGEPFKHVPGRTGDDCIAFQLDNNNEITRSLVCESKCTLKHDMGLINDAHEKISKENNPVPVNAWRLLDILRERRGDPEAAMWVRAIARLRSGKFVSNYERCDFVCYVCGQEPKLNPSWMPQTTPHHTYKANRRLESVELHLVDVKALVHRVYRKAS